MTSDAELDEGTRRLLYRARHRGTKEMDWLLGRFADATAPLMSPDERHLFEQLLALPDPEIDFWIRAGEAPEMFAPIVTQLRRFHGLES